MNQQTQKPKDLSEFAYMLIQQIEKCGASEELTKATVMACELRDGIDTILNEKGKIESDLSDALSLRQLNKTQRDEAYAVINDLRYEREKAYAALQEKEFERVEIKRQLENIRRDAK